MCPFLEMIRSKYSNLDSKRVLLCSSEYCKGNGKLDKGSVFVFLLTKLSKAFYCLFDEFSDELHDKIKFT